MARFNLGGPAQQISSLMEHLNKDEFVQKLVVGQCADDEIDFSEVQTLSFEIVRSENLGRKINILSDIYALLDIIKILYRFRPNIIHSHTAKAGVIARIARIFYPGKVHLVHTYHGHLLYGYFNRWQTKLVVYLERLLALFTTKLVTVGTRVRNELVEAKVASLNKFVVIPPGINFGTTSPHVARVTTSKLRANQISIGFVGRITKIKRPDKFLGIVEQVQSVSLPTTFYVAGNGNLADEMQAHATSRGLDINFLGWVADVESLFDELDVLILTSDNEGTPISIVQAAAHGCISLSTNVGSVEDVLIDGETGFMCETISQFVEQIQHLTSNPSKLQYMKSKARDFSRTNFSGVRLARDHEFLYKSIIDPDATLDTRVLG